MKKGLLVILCLMISVLLVACGESDNNSDINNEDSLVDLQEKTPLTIEDLDRIDEYRFPKSYTYSVYDFSIGDSAIEEGEHVYPDEVDHKLLLPIHENMDSRKIISSVMSHDRIVTTVDVTLKNGELYPVTYINDPDTLEYISATVNTPTNTISYTFNY